MIRFIGVSVDELSKLSSGKVQFKEQRKSSEEELTSKHLMNVPTMLLKIVIRWILITTVSLLTYVMETGYRRTSWWIERPCSNDG